MKSNFPVPLFISVSLCVSVLLGWQGSVSSYGSTTRKSDPAAALHYYYGNLHSHTAYSDGTGTPKEAFRYARDVAKLDFLAVTEHNHAKAEGTGDDPLNLHIAKDHNLYKQLIADANAADESDKFVAIYGQEYSTMAKGGNHTNIFMAKKVIETPNGDYVHVFTDEWMSEYGVRFIQMNHPWEAGVQPMTVGTSQDVNYGRSKFSSLAAFIRAVEGRAVLLEVINGPGTRKPAQGQILASKRNAGYYFQYLNMGLHLAPTADQDNHWRTWGTLTTARTVVLASRLTREAILKALSEGHVYASQDNDQEVHFTVNGNIMGSRLDAVGTGESVSIAVRVDDGHGNSSYKIKVYYDNAPAGGLAQVVSQQTVKNHVAISFDHVPKKGKGYYFIEIKSMSGENRGLMTWTAPIWFE